MRLDELDHSVLRELKRDARITNRELGERLGVHVRTAASFAAAVLFTIALTVD